VEKATIGIVDLVPYVKDVKRAEDIEWPKISRVYYISVKNIKENEKYYEDWVNSWLPGREETLDYILHECGSLPLPTSIPEPEMLPALPKGWGLVVHKEKNLVPWNTFNHLLFKEKLLNYNDFRRNNDEYFSFYNDLFSKIKGIRTTITGTNLIRGYVISTNIFSSDYPIINVIAEKFINKSEWRDISQMQKAKIYNWIINIIVLEIYYICLKSISKLKEISLINLDVRKEFLIKDLISQFKVTSEWSRAFLDNSIKQHLLKKKIKVLAEISTGFDTEYVPIEYGRNELISAQLSITGRIKMEIPRKNKYIFEGVNTLTSENFPKAGPSIINLEMLERSINDYIQEIRELLFNNYDTKVKSISHYFKMNDKNIDNIVINESAELFSFNKKPIVNKFIIGKDGEKLKINFSTLTKIINESVNLEDEKAELVKTISDIPIWSLPNELSYTKNTKSWNGKTLIQYPIEEVILSNEENMTEKEDFVLAEGDSFVNMKTVNYLCAHYNAADLSMLEDWDEIKTQNIDIIKKSYTSLKLPIKCLGHEIHIRDTLLLSSAAAGSLANVAKAYKMEKIEIPNGQNYYSNMDKLLLDHKDIFKEYAMQDSLITLIHALFIGEFSFKVGMVKLPNTLGSISSKYLKNQWEKDGFKGYQINYEYLLGDAQGTHTPKGITALGLAGDSLNQFLASFRGGRNECFSYGIDKAETWYDYDLTSCYATIMSMCGEPQYDAEASANEGEQKILDHINKTSNSIRQEKNYLKEKINDHSDQNKNDQNDQYLNDIEEEELTKITPDVSALIKEPDYIKISALYPNSDLTKYDFKKSYTALRVKFCLPSNVLYPPIPVSLDKNITIYPLSGESTITGLEFASAKNILNSALNELALGGEDLKVLQKNYFINIISGTYIPFKEKGYSPFYPVINDLQSKRRLYAKLDGKKSAMERIFKDLGNMLYGKVVCGISNKRSYDSRLMQMISMQPGFITNPMVGSWITGFVRALLAELLNVTHKLGGKITAVTTDGFVTNIPDLENKIMKYFEENNVENSFLLQYKNIRQKLSGISDALEVKTNVRGIIQWTTRGQLSYIHTDSDLNNYKIPIAAMTGFQKYHFTQERLVKLVTNSLNNNNEIFFLLNRLTGALDNYKLDSAVTMTSSLRRFRTIFDCKRVIITSDESMLYTKPYICIEDAFLVRSLMNNLRQPVYSNEYSSKKLLMTSYSAKDLLLKYYIRIVCEYFNWRLNYYEKYLLIKQLNINLGYSEDKISDTINHTLENIGSVTNNFPYFRGIEVFVKGLFNTNNIDVLIDYKHFVGKFKLYNFNLDLVPFDRSKSTNLMIPDNNNFFAKLYALYVDYIESRNSFINKLIIPIPIASPPPSPIASPTSFALDEIIISSKMKDFILISPTVPPATAPVELVQPNPVPDLLVPWPETLPTEDIVILEKPKKRMKISVRGTPAPAPSPSHSVPFASPSPVVPFGKPLGPVAPPKKKTTQKWEDKFGHRGSPEDS